MHPFPTIADATIEPIEPVEPPEPPEPTADDRRPGGTDNPRMGITGAWVTLPAAARAAGATVSAPGGRWMALERYIPWWPRPVIGAGDGSSAPEGEYFLALFEEPDGTVTALLPTLDGDTRTALRGGAQGWSLRGVALDPEPSEALAAILAHGADAVEVVAWAVARLAERLGTFRLRADKPTPRWIEDFGWCTWDAFYEDVTADKVLDGLASFAGAGASPRTLILDAGWQPVRDELLEGFGAVPERFPDGLGPMIAAAKERFGVRTVGVWQTLQGYWQGVDPDGELGARYRVVETERDAGTPAVPGIRRRGLVHPDDVARFYDDYHGRLRAQGVDMVKVDNQAALEHFATAELPPTSIEAAYEDALQTAVERHFGGESLHCMSHTVGIAYRLDRGAVWRSSQDFFPDQPHTHGLHIFDNALNSVWSSTFAVCDWDMFQSGHEAGPFHAAARAISGGPVYVSDRPGQQDASVIRSLTVSDGSVLRSAQPALPAARSIFVDGRSTPTITVVTNRNEVAGLDRPIGVLGLFSCAWDGEAPVAASGEYAVSDIRDLGDGPHAVWRRSTDSVTVDDGKEVTVALPPLGWDLLTVSPIDDGLALFGLLDKLNGSRAITSVSRDGAGDDAGAVRVVLADGGRFGWYAGRPVAATIAGSAVTVSRDGALSWTEVPVGGPIEIVLADVNA